MVSHTRVSLLLETKHFQTSFEIDARNLIATAFGGKCRGDEVPIRKAQSMAELTAETTAGDWMLPDKQAGVREEEASEVAFLHGSVAVLLCVSISQQEPAGLCGALVRDMDCAPCRRAG